MLSEKSGLELVYTINDENVIADFSKSGYRLPTEAEWEYAARSGGKSNQIWPGTNIESNLVNYAWYAVNSQNKTHIVGTKQQNDLGIYDMSGNVWEWCWDWSGDYSYSLQVNPVGPSTGLRRICRGGHWEIWSYFCRLAYRGAALPSNNGSDIGFRLARNSN